MAGRKRVYETNTGTGEFQGQRVSFTQVFEKLGKDIYRLIETTFVFGAGMSFSPITTKFHLTFVVVSGKGFMCRGGQIIHPYEDGDYGFIMQGQPFGVVEVKKDTVFSMTIHPTVASTKMLCRAIKIGREAIEHPYRFQLQHILDGKAE